MPQAYDGSFPVRLYAYDDAGTLLRGFANGFPIAPRIATPDQTASLDGDPSADWVAPTRALLSTEFATLELVRDDQPGTPFARYVYVPGSAVYIPAETDCFRPSAETGSAVVLF